MGHCAGHESHTGYPVHPLTQEGEDLHFEPAYHSLTGNQDSVNQLQVQSVTHEPPD